MDTYKRFFGRSPLSKGVSPDESESGESELTHDVTKNKSEVPVDSMEEYHEFKEKSRWKKWKKHRSISINETYRNQL